MGDHQEVMYIPHNTDTQYIYRKLNGDICGETERGRVRDKESKISDSNQSPAICFRLPVRECSEKRHPRL